MYGEECEKSYGNRDKKHEKSYNKKITKFF